MKNYFYIAACLLYLPLQAMENDNNNNPASLSPKDKEVAAENSNPKEQRLHLYEHADTAAAASFTEKTANAMKRLLGRFDGDYFYIKAATSSSSLSSVQMKRWHQKPAELTPTEIDAIFASIPETDRNTPEKTAKLLQHMSHTVLRVEKESQANLDHAKQMAVENKIDKENIWKGTKQFVYSTALISAVSVFYRKFPGWFYSSKENSIYLAGWASLIAIPVAINCFFKSLFAFDKAKAHPKNIQEKVELEQIQYNNIQLLKPYVCVKNQSGEGTGYTTVDTVDQAANLSIWQDLEKIFVSSK